MMNELTLLIPVLFSVPLQTVAVGALGLALMNSNWLSGGIVLKQGLWEKCYRDNSYSGADGSKSRDDSSNLCFDLPPHG